MKKQAHFRICDRKGFQLTFKNGYILSVQFGPGNYCSNQNRSLRCDPALPVEDVQSNTAEIAIFGPRRGYHTRKAFRECFNSGAPDSAGWVSIDQIPALVTWCANHTN